MIDEEGLLASFVDESQQHLQTIEPDLLELEKGGNNIDYEVINRIFRSVHSIKGASGFFGLQKIGELSHVMENLLSLLRDKKITVYPELTDALLSGVDALRAMVDDVAASETFDIQENLKQLHGLLNNVGTPPKSVAISEKTQTGEIPKKTILTFEIPEDEVKKLISSGKYLYSVKIFLNKDLREKGKTPYDYINSIESLGQFVDSFLDVAGISGLTDCLDNDLAFNYIFSTVLDPDLISVGLEVAEDKITIFDLEKFKSSNAFKNAQTDSSVSTKPKPEVKEEVLVTEIKTENVVEVLKENNVAEKAAPSDDDSKVAVSKTALRPVQAEDKLRVSVGLTNELVNLAGELVLGRNQLMEISAPLVKQASGLNTVLQHVSRVTTEMQEKIMQLRMQPVSVVFAKFHRVVRDLSKNLNKDIVLETYGEDVELDKSIIEALSDPLTHLIRNSADHGIETPEEREKKGKPRQGKIILRAYHEGGQVHLEVSDNGKGINTKVVGNKAVEKGVITREQMENMSERELMKLITKPGFSTAEKVSSVSGRGVGMDVVVTNIEHIGGTIEIESVLDEGSTIKLILPLTLAIVSGLVIKLWDQIFILPEVNIDELVRIKPEEIKDRINRVQDSWILRLRDMLVPLIDLKLTLSSHSENSISDEKIELENQPFRIIILKYGSSRLGLIVDSVEDIEEIVVKPLPLYLKRMKCYSGTTIMGNGRVALILDIGGIIEEANLEDIEKKLDARKSDLEEIQVDHDTQTLLLFHNNTEERFALPLELITRIESVPVSKIEKIKDKQFFQYQGENLRLIFLEDYLPIAKPERKPEDKIGVIIPKIAKHPMGIVMYKVLDTINTKIELDTKTIMAPALFGSSVINDRITLIIDMYRLFEISAPDWYDEIKPDMKNKKTRKKILLVEDTPFFRMVETEYLESAGYIVVQADDGIEALKMLEKQSFDAVVLDIIMPGLDGWGVIKAIRDDERWKKMPVMALTTLADEETANKGLESGFTAWETKLNKTVLLEKLNSILNI